MTKFGLVYIRGDFPRRDEVKTFLEERSYLPKEIKERIINTSRDDSMAERLSAYLLLYRMLGFFSPFSESNEFLPSIDYSRKKPFFKAGLRSDNQYITLPVFNISHSGAISAVIISNECDVGTDIQKMPSDPKILYGVEKRFLLKNDARIGKNCSLISEGVRYFLDLSMPRGLSEADLFERENGLRCAISEEERILQKFSDLEAELKLFGDGFSGFSKKRDMKNTFFDGGITTFGGEVYAVSVLTK